jgi:hypothetical protein
MSDRFAVAALVVGLALPLASPALASEVTRDSYREAVEPICKSNTQANERIFKGVRAEVRKDELKPAAARFEKAAKALKRTLAQLRGVPRPEADRARLQKWLGIVGDEAGLFERVAAKLRAGEKVGAERLVVRLNGNATRANNVVIPFEFHYCRLEPSRFT